MSNRFFPPLIPICQSEHGLTVPEQSDHENHKFPSLFAAQLIKIEEILPRTLCELKILPYDLFCPSVHSNIVDRCCKICNVYFASNVILKQHLVIHRRPKQVEPESVPPPRVRPIRVAARRQRELMAIIAAESSKAEQCDWMDEDDLDLTNVSLQSEKVEKRKIPIRSMDKHFSSPWENVEDSL